MKKLFLLLALVGFIFTACETGGDLGDGGGGQVDDPNNPLNNKKCADNEILYISKSCLPMELNTYDGWGAKLTSNTYENGVGRLTFNGDVITIPEKAFYKNELLEYIKMPNSVTKIGNYAFQNCRGLISVTIPDSVTSIGAEAFYCCSSLASVTIPNSVTSIGSDAFRGCSSLTSITIPDSVTSIGNSAFYSCGSLKYVYCKPTTPPTGNSNMFDNNELGRKIYVPSSSLDRYKRANYWSNYAKYIVAYDF